MKRNVTIIPPAEFTGLKEIPIKDAAVGLPAVTSALHHISEELGLWKGMKTLLKLNQRDGIDCPGCAWPDPDHRSKLGEYCENGAKAIAEEATDKKCDPDFFARHTVEEISSWSDYKIGKSGRITQPMYLAKGELYYRPISWQAAFDIIGSELRSCNPSEAVFYTSGRTSNEAAYMYQLLVRQYGTNNLPDCSNMCHESSGVALTETIGIGKGTVKLEDIYHAKLVMVIGQNPGTNHPRMMSALSQCKGNGGRIIHINPLPEVGTTKFINPQSPLEILKGGTQLADIYLPVKIGGDFALMQYIQHRLYIRSLSDANVFDQSFVDSKTLGFDAWTAYYEKFEISEDEFFSATGLSKAEVEHVVDELIATDEIISCWAMGLTQQKHGVATIQELVNIHLLRGAIGKPNAGVCPVRGHSNVQGDRTMGIYEKPKPAFIDRLDNYWNRSFVREEGYDVVESIQAMEKRKVSVFIAMGGNFISATPDSERTGKAMQNVSLTVQISTKLNRAHCVTGDHALILPCLGRTEKDLQKSGEQFVTVENSMGVVHMSRGINAPCSSELMSEPAIVSGIAQSLFQGSDQIDWKAMVENYDVIRNHIEGSIAGFDDYNIQVRKSDGFYLPNGPREGRFTTQSGKAHFTISTLEVDKVAPGHFIMMTIRSHDQYNTTIYGLDDRYRGITNERRVVLINPKDMSDAGLRKMDEVDVVSHYNNTERVAERFLIVPFEIARGCVATYFPETNCLVPLEHTARKSNTPVSKWIEVELRVRI
jgi:molybdopterin-dependent oxidoreductase alpha subunit